VGRLIAVVVFDEHSSFGLVRMQLSRTAQQLVRVLEEAGKPQTRRSRPIVSDPSGARTWPPAG